MKLKPLTKLPRDLKPGDVLIDRNGNQWPFDRYNMDAEPNSQVVMRQAGVSHNSVGLDGRCFLGETNALDIVRVIRKASAKKPTARKAPIPLPADVRRVLRVLKDFMTARVEQREAERIRLWAAWQLHLEAKQRAEKRRKGGR